MVYDTYNYLVGGFNLALWKMMDFVSLGWWHSQYDAKLIKFMFQTTNQMTYISRINVI